METVIKLLSPMVPHITAELWRMIGHHDPLDTVAWPLFDAEAAKEDEVTVVIQVSGKVRSRLQVAVGTDDATLQTLALADERVSKYIGDQPIRKVIVVKEKLINIVV
jgi:leucyl-tRNA synthetase